MGRFRDEMRGNVARSRAEGRRHGQRFIGQISAFHDHLSTAARNRPLEGYHRKISGGNFAVLRFHNWQACLECGAVVATLDGLQAHEAFHEQQDDLIELVNFLTGIIEQAGLMPADQAEDLQELAARARAEGHAEVGS